MPKMNTNSHNTEMNAYSSVFGLLKKSEESHKHTVHLVDKYGDGNSRNRLRSLKEELQRGVDARAPDFRPRYVDELYKLYSEALNRQDSFHVWKFNRFLEPGQSIHVPGQEEVIGQRRRANNNV